MTQLMAEPLRNTMGHIHNGGITKGEMSEKDDLAKHVIGTPGKEGSKTNTSEMSGTTKVSSSPTSKRWLSALEEPSIARVQQFIIDTLRNPVRFMVSQQNAVPELPYKPINDSAALAERKEKAAKKSEKNKKQVNGKTDDIMLHVTDDRTSSTLTTESPSKTSSSATIQSPTKKTVDLFPYKISLHSPKVMGERGVGLNNRGNTCYMNSTLQALLHLPPLSHALLMLDTDQLYGRLGAQPTHKFDAIGEMSKLAQRSLVRRGGGNGNEMPTAPTAFIADLKSYARTLVKYRQEDAHEFLRFLLEAMQICCLIRAPKSLKPFDPIRETTLIHKIFGGKLRSRVTCGRCKFNSDTYDTMLDLSLDLRKLNNNSLTSALENFTGTDHLSGGEKYRCEKCKMPVNATKRFTIDQSPNVLTIHLKRFTLTGQKITKPINFGEELTLNKNVLSEGQPIQKYRLHAIIHHHGSGPNSGHYIASVRGSSGKRWFEMNDSSVNPLRAAPINSPSAYVLFYVRTPENALNNVLHQASGLAVDSKKRRLEEDSGDDHGDTIKRHAVNGLVSPSRPINGSTPLRSNGLTNSSLKKPSSSYADQEDDSDLGESVETASNGRSSSQYESLIGSNKPLSKKQRRKMRASGIEGVRPSSAGESRTPKKGSQSLVTSPFFANRAGGTNRMDNGLLARERMKNKQGQRVGRSF